MFRRLTTYRTAVIGGCFTFLAAYPTARAELWKYKKSKEVMEYHAAIQDEASNISLEDAIKYKHASRVVTQAYRDIGFNNPVYIHFGSGDSTQTFNSFDKDYKRSAFVFVNVSYISSDHELYAVAGHEAVHALDEHCMKRALIKGVLLSASCSSFLLINSFSFLVSIPMYCYSTMYISRYFEKKADITSAEKLGTANGLIQFLLQRESIESDFNLSSDPSLKERIEYVERYHLSSHPSHKERSYDRKLCTAVN
jgi:Zn-dependent protease with chaperone function